MSIGEFGRRNAGLVLQRFTTGEWLTAPLIAFAATTMIAGTLAAIGFLILTGHGGVDIYGRPFGADFSSFWSAGRMALAGHASESYDWSAHSDVLQHSLGTNLYYPWSYPPAFLLVAAGLALLPYFLALCVFQGATSFAAFCLLRGILPFWPSLIAGIGFPGVLICVLNGQTGFLTAALSTAGLLALPRRELMAGFFFGLLVYKPQFGLLLPFVLIAGGYWRAVLSASITVSAFILLTVWLWGWRVWRAFFDSIILTRSIVLESGNTGFHKFHSAFTWMRLWGGSLDLAYSVQAALTFVVIVVCIKIWRSGVDMRLKGAALFLGTLLSTPYVLDYDFILLGMAIALLVAYGLQHGFQPWHKTVMALAWFMPLIAREIARTTSVPIGFLTVSGLFLITILCARHELSEIAMPVGRSAPMTPV